MQIGELRNYIKIQNKVMVENENLEKVEEWKDFKECWAEIRPLDGREYWSARQTTSEITGKIKIRYTAGITNKMRVVDESNGSKIYDIEAVIDTENKHKELVLLVKEK